MNLYQEIYPPPSTVLEMEPEELAPFVLQHLDAGDGGNLNKHNFTIGTQPHFIEWAGQDNRQRNLILQRFMVTWQRLEKELFIAPKPGSVDWTFITHRGRQVLEAQDFETYKKGHMLPSEGLDPILVQKAKQSFIRGDYDTAVFQAFKEVEIRVRQKAKLSDSEIGVKLMRAAFKPDGGILTDPDMEPGEKSARMELFAGTIGSFKNPRSHRDVELSNPQDAVELIYMASHLLRIVDNIETH